ncbi:hypothetical protein [Cellulomonas sp. SG140]|uniref:hypothetical protein n=1 Tax=Cellulomonas sp. SG140 TaxID=2976536 RepID=UPI0021E7EAED|nr:hypothetical protein [Cellulomonas sp. SG140]
MIFSNSPSSVEYDEATGNVSLTFISLTESSPDPIRGFPAKALVVSIPGAIVADIPNPTV